MLYPERSPKIGLLENSYEARQNAVGGRLMLLWPNYQTIPELQDMVLISQERGLISDFNGYASATGLVVGGAALLCGKGPGDDIVFEDISDDAVEWMQRRFPSLEITIELFDFASGGDFNASA